ncbi:hypothetical protein Tco_1104668 [Tanacetum coccineum]
MNFFIAGTLYHQVFFSPPSVLLTRPIPFYVIHPTSEPSTPTNVHAEENNDNQADDTEHEFTNPFCTPVQEVDESSSPNIDFSDVDHAGCIDTRKTTSGGIQFLGDKLVSWMSKKEDYTAMSSAEAEYVALSEQVENGIIELYFIKTEYQLADMFTKALPEDSKYGESNAIALEDLTLRAGNPVKEILLIELPDHSTVQTGVAASFKLESNSLPHAHAQIQRHTIMHKSQESKKALVLKTTTSVNSDIKDPSSETSFRGKFLASFQDDAQSYENVVQTQDRKWWQRRTRQNKEIFKRISKRKGQSQRHRQKAQDQDHKA